MDELEIASHASMDSYLTMDTDVSEAQVLSLVDELRRQFDKEQSNAFFIVTIVINTVMTTTKNIVRLIREGIFSIIRAVKLLLNPPEHMTREQTFHEAGKIMIAALAVSIGILMEETVDKFPPMKAIRSIPIVGDLLYGILFGLLTALITAFGLWGWDKLDLFGVKEQAKHEHVMKALREDRKAELRKRDEWLKRIKEVDVERYLFLRRELALE